MIVVADSSPLNYLILIGVPDVLSKLYGQVVIPPAVHRELQRGSTPVFVREWIARSPKWLEVREVSTTDALLSRLGEGEKEAILLAQEIDADALLIDERDGRRMALSRHLTVIGTLQILDSAAEAGLLDLRSALARLQQTTFRVTPRLLNHFLQRNAERERAGEADAK